MLHKRTRTLTMTCSDNIFMRKMGGGREEQNSEKDATQREEKGVKYLLK